MLEKLDERVSRTLLLWLWLPQLGVPLRALPSQIHPLEKEGGQCSKIPSQELDPTPLSEWLRIPLDVSGFVSEIQPGAPRTRSVMDAYLDSFVSAHDLKLLGEALLDDRLWCAHVATDQRFVARFAEIASLRIAHEITKFFFPPAFTKGCLHRSVKTGHHPAMMWDPRILLPTEAGRRVRESLLESDVRICGPHAMLRATESYLPDLVPIGLQVEDSPKKLFRLGATSDLRLLSVGEVVSGECGLPSTLFARALLKAALEMVLKYVKPLAKVLPRGIRARARRRLMGLFPESLVKETDMALVSASLGFAPVAIHPAEG